jgi:hypothetical protein
VTLTHGWIQKFFSRHSTSVANAVVSPHELPRLQTSRCNLDKYVNLLKAYIPFVPSELIFNLDETGLSDWGERRSEPLPITADGVSRPLHYPVDHGIHDQTLLCCISASGDAYCPCYSLRTAQCSAHLRREFARTSMCKSKFSVQSI